MEWEPFTTSVKIVEIETGRNVQSMEADQTYYAVLSYDKKWIATSPYFPDAKITRKIKIRNLIQLFI